MNSFSLANGLQGSEGEAFSFKGWPWTNTQCPVSQFRLGSTAIHFLQSDPNRNCSAAAISPSRFAPWPQEVGICNSAQILKVSWRSTKAVVWPSLRYKGRIAAQVRCTLSGYSTRTCLWQASWRHKVEMACSKWPQLPKPWLRECFQTSQTDHCLPHREHAANHCFSCGKRKKITYWLI